MGKQYTQEDYDNVRRYIDSDLDQKVISQLVGRSQSSVCYLMQQIKDGNEEIKRVGGKIDLKELEEVDLSKYPDHVLFRHSKEYIL